MRATAGNPQPDGIVLGAGAQFIHGGGEGPSPRRRPDDPTPLGSFSVTLFLGQKPDKVGKDDNFRGLTIFNNVVYLTKGSGGNGVNTVYFIDTSAPGHGVCPNGVGLPMPGASLPVASPRLRSRDGGGVGLAE